MKAEAMKVPKELEVVLSVDPDIMHGDICFVGTRVPLTVLLDNLAEGMGIDEFGKYYPSVKRSQVEAILNWERKSILEAVGMP